MHIITLIFHIPIAWSLVEWTWKIRVLFLLVSYEGLTPKHQFLLALQNPTLTDPFKKIKSSPAYPESKISIACIDHSYMMHKINIHKPCIAWNVSLSHMHFPKTYCCQVFTLWLKSNFVGTYKNRCLSVKFQVLLFIWYISRCFFMSSMYSQISIMFWCIFKTYPM